MGNLLLGLGLAVVVALLLNKSIGKDFNIKWLSDIANDNLSTRITFLLLAILVIIIMYIGTSFSTFTQSKQDIYPEGFSESEINHKYRMGNERIKIIETGEKELITIENTENNSYQVIELNKKGE